MSLKEFFQPNHLNKLLIIFAVTVVLLFVFVAGIFVGHEKGRFSRNWKENYCGNIMGPGRPGMMNFNKPDFNAHSGLGQIMKIEANSIVVKDQNNIEKTILVTDKTAIVRGNQNIKIADLKIDDRIVTIGRPNNLGQIEGRLIRVMPAPLFDKTTATSTGPAFNQ